MTTTPIAFTEAAILKLMTQAGVHTGAGTLDKQAWAMGYMIQQAHGVQCSAGHPAAGWLTWCSHLLPSEPMLQPVQHRGECCRDALLLLYRVGRCIYCQHQLVGLGV
jgi:hypothetical protein